MEPQLGERIVGLVVFEAMARSVGTTSQQGSDTEGSEHDIYSV